MFRESRSMILLDLIHCLVHKCLRYGRWLQFLIWNFLIIKFYNDVHCSRKLTLHQEEMIFVDHMFQSEKLIDTNGKIGQNSNLVHIIKRNILCQRIPSLPWLVLTSLVDIEIDHILELDQWNHADALDAK